MFIQQTYSASDGSAVGVVVVVRAVVVVVDIDLTAGVVHPG